LLIFVSMSGVVLILFFTNYKVNTPALFLSSQYPFYTTPGVLGSFFFRIEVILSNKNFEKIFI
jgi:hypothetical protein